MSSKLPAWVVSDEQSVLAEAEPYVEASAETRLRHLRMVCRAAMKIVRSRPDAATVMAHRDPVPQSTRDAYRVLRARAKGRPRQEGLGVVQARTVERTREQGS